MTVDEVNGADAHRQAASLPRKVFWGFEAKGRRRASLEPDAVSGILFVTLFRLRPRLDRGRAARTSAPREGSIL